MLEVDLKRELSAIGQAVNINALSHWETKITEYLEDIQAGVEALNNTAPQNKEEQHEIFLLKKKNSDILVERVTIDKGHASCSYQIESSKNFRE